MKPTLKIQVLTALETARGEFVSGQALADRLGVTRTAVWKAITALRADGHAIDSSPKSGYMLARRSDKLSAESIRAALPAKYKALDITVFERIDSTNDEAKRMLAQGAKNAVYRRGQRTDRRPRPAAAAALPPRPIRGCI